MYSCVQYSTYSSQANSVACIMLRVILVLLLSVNLLKAACPDGLFATHVTATSAMLHWRNRPHGRRNRVKDFQVKCTGIRHYTAADGTHKMDTDSVVHYVPRVLEHILIGNLQPNFNYSCSVTAEGGACSLRRSRPHHFSTHYKAPEPPLSPHVQKLPSDDIMIVLSPASSEYGPISGYKLQFHVVDDKTPYVDDLPYLPEQVLTPSGPLASLAEAQGTSHPVSFQLAFANKTFPLNITVDNSLMNGALKNGASYSVVTVAYSNVTDAVNGSTRTMFSASKPSVPFVAAGQGVQPNRTTKVSLRKRNGAITAALVIGVVFPSLVILYASCIGAYIVCKEYQALKDKTDTEDHVYSRVVQDEPEELHPLLKEDTYIRERVSQTSTPVSELHPQRDPFMKLPEYVPASDQTDESFPLLSFESGNTSSDQITAADMKSSAEIMDELDLPGENIGLLSLSEVTIFRKESHTAAIQDDAEMQQSPMKVDSTSDSTRNRCSGEATSNSKSWNISAASEMTFHSACDWSEKSASDFGSDVSDGASIGSVTEIADVEVEPKDLTTNTQIEDLMEFTETVSPHHSDISEHTSHSSDVAIPDEYLESHYLSTADSDELLDVKHLIPEGDTEMRKAVDSSDEEKVESGHETVYTAEEHWASESCVDTSEEDKLAVGRQKSSASVHVSSGKDSQLQSRISSHVFVPRRASGGQQHRVGIDTQLSVLSTHSQLSQNQQNDQAPDLEMDLFDFDPDMYA